MMQIEWNAAKKKKYIDFGWNGRGKADSSVRAVKMLRPICTICQADPEHAKNWYEVCQHGGEDGMNIFMHDEFKTVNVPVYEPDEDGDMVLNEEKSVVKNKKIRVPNFTEVPADLGHNSGQGYEKARAKGFVLPEEKGYAPLCQFSGCGKTFPTIRTDTNGDYCSIDHAKLSQANADETILIAPTDAGHPGKDMGKERRRQIQEIVI